MPRFTRLSIAMLAATLVLGACGGGGDEEDPEPTAEESVTPEETMEETPTPTETPLSDTTLLAEDFESTTTAFELGTNGNAEVSLEDGQLKLYSEDDEAESIAPLLAPTEGLTFDVDVTLGESKESLAAGTQDWFGIGCTSGEDAYFMLADVTGSFFLFSRKNGKYDQITDNYKQSFQPVDGTELQMSAGCAHDPSGPVGLSLFIDGEEVLVGSDAKDPLPAFDGVVVFGQQDVNEKGGDAFSTFFFDNVDVQLLES